MYVRSEINKKVLKDITELHVHTLGSIGLLMYMLEPVFWCKLLQFGQK